MKESAGKVLGIVIWEYLCILTNAQLYSRYLCMDLGAGATRDASREHASALARTPPTRAN